jgi:prophage regulatory protein
VEYATLIMTRHIMHTSQATQSNQTQSTQNASNQHASTQQPAQQSSHQNLLPGQLRIIRLKQVIELTGLSRSTIYDVMNPKSTRYDPDFPKSIQLTQGTVGWVYTEVEQWIENKIKQAREQTS